MSFRERATLSLISGADDSLPDNCVSIGKNRSLKTAVLYGANASGKSNLLKAFASSIAMLRQSNGMQIDQPLALINPFKADAFSRTKPSSFEYVFIVNETKYVYGFSATRERIEEEYLYAYYSAKPSKLFERTGAGKFAFASDKRKLEMLAQKNSPNKLFLATATAWNYEKTKEPYLWFSEKIDTFSSDLWLRDLSVYSGNDSGSLKNFIKKIFRTADNNISDFAVCEKELSKEELSVLIQDPMLPEVMKNAMIHPKFKRYSFDMIHRVKGSDNEETYSFGLNEESLGTQRLFFMAPHLENAFARGRTILVDELNASLHPILVEMIVSMFHDPDVNRADAQLIFTTHDVNLLDLDLFRRDQIYFTEKNPETATSVLYSLDEFAVRKQENIRKGYMQGRFGAIPFVGGGDTLWK
jgi:AAA15 family ATPase/GTPase